MTRSDYRPDREVQALIDQVAAAGALTLQARGVAGARDYLEQNAAGGAPGPPLATVDDHLVDAAAPVAVRVYRPATDAALPLVTYFHGGGWVVGSVSASDAFCRGLAAAGPCVVVSVDYRLAPEHPWPAALHDAVAVIRWVAHHAHDLGGDADRVVVLGDSAGGNVATVAARHLVADTTVARQILAYPTIRTTQSSPSHVEHGAGWPLFSSDLAWFVDLYVPDDSARDHPDICPLTADVSGMPPTTLLLAGCDPLFDEGIEYADHLVAAGVPVDLHVYAGQIHGFVTFPDEVLPRSREALGVVANAVRCA